MNVFGTTRNIILSFVLLFGPVWASAATLLPFSSGSSSCGVFLRDLKLGMTGNDVRELQQILNRAPGTQIALIGPGSPGQETDFFGMRTKVAVSLFQELYKEEVLIPAGLMKGTGYFGKLTRAKLGMICANSTSSVSVNPSPTPLLSSPPPLPKMSERLTPIGVGLSGTSPSSTVSDTGTTIVIYPNNYTVTPGSKVELHGSQFASSGNVVHIGNTYTITGATIGSFGTLDFTLPLDAPLGKVALWVRNAKGESNKSFLIIKSPAIPAPAIESVTPIMGKLGNVLTVTGSGFTSLENEVRFGDMTITGIPSLDGKTLVFTATSTVFANAINSGTTSPRIPFFIYVLNAGGISNGQSFTLTF